MVVEILVECPDEELDKNEIECIELYRTLAPEGYNCTTGGETKKEYCEETKKNISDGLKRGLAEGRVKMPNNVGRNHSEKTKQKMKRTRNNGNWRILNNKKRRGTVYFANKSKKWVSKGPHPRRKHIGYFKTEGEARIALEKYKKNNPEEFD